MRRRGTNVRLGSGAHPRSATRRSHSEQGARWMAVRLRDATRSTHAHRRAIREAHVESGRPPFDNTHRKAQWHTPEAPVTPTTSPGDTYREPEGPQRGRPLSCRLDITRTSGRRAACGCERIRVRRGDRRAGAAVAAPSASRRARSGPGPERAQTPAARTELICCGSPQTISRAPARPRARGRAVAATSPEPPLTATTTTGREAARRTAAASV